MQIGFFDHAASSVKIHTGSNTMPSYQSNIAWPTRQTEHSHFFEPDGIFHVAALAPMPDETDHYVQVTTYEIVAGFGPWPLKPRRPTIHFHDMDRFDWRRRDRAQYCPT